MSADAIAAQLNALERCVHDLALLGCRVVSVYGSSLRQRARVHIAQPDALLDHVDGDRYVVGAPGAFFECGVIYHDCEVFWLSEKLVRREHEEVSA